MLEELTDKVFSWSQEKADLFHNFLSRDTIDGKYIWEHTNDGTYLYRDVTATFLRNDGIVFKISKWFANQDWNMHLRLYELSNNNGFRIDIPLEQKKFLLANEEWVYIKIQRPNFELGIDNYVEIMSNNVNNDYFLEYIDQTATISRVMRDLSRKYNTGCPEVGIPVTKRLRDSKGHFWFDFKRWRLDFDKFVDKNLHDIDIICRYIEKNIPDIDINREKIIIQAEKKWNILRK
jgi:hypothetical protein